MDESKGQAGGVLTPVAIQPCPFCGMTSAFVERADYSSCFVQCDCNARGPVALQQSDDEEIPGHNSAIAAWNRRPTPAAAADLTVDGLMDRAKRYRWAAEGESADGAERVLRAYAEKLVAASLAAAAGVPTDTTELQADACNRVHDILLSLVPSIAGEQCRRYILEGLALIDTWLGAAGWSPTYPRPVLAYSCKREAALGQPACIGWCGSAQHCGASFVSRSSPVAPAGAPADHQEAWCAVVDTLSEVSPGWLKPGRSGIESAIATIKRMALLSAGSQGEQHGDGIDEAQFLRDFERNMNACHPAAPQSSVASPSPRSSLSETDDSALPQGGVGGPTYYVRHPDDSYTVADPQPASATPSAGSSE